MLTIRDFHRLQRVEGDVGVEIEVEGSNLPQQLVRWRCTNDPSLKAEEAVEYVLRAPVGIQQLQDCLQELKNAFVLKKSRFDDTYRAGVHVHVNVQHLTIKQVFNFITCVLILEELLLKFCAYHRTGNHFCLRATEAQYLPQLLWKVVEEQDLHLLDTDDIRYSFMNLKTLKKYGSVEFRALESTFDFDKIDQWAKILYTLRQSALEFDSPRAIMESVSLGGYEQFVRMLLKEHADFFLAQKDWQKDVRKGILIAQDIAYARDWTGKSLNIFAKKGVW